MAEPITLRDRFEECCTAGLAGIPRPELLAYLREAAVLLDRGHQNDRCHLNVTPHTLCQAESSIVLVGEWGSGTTPAYSAPETLDGVIHRGSDQYGLAIVFQEMLTGSRPFHGTNLHTLVLQHLYHAPDLSPLPDRDQPLVSRALSKKPDDRYPTCGAFVAALQAAT